MSQRCRRVLRSRRRLPVSSCDGISTNRNGSALASVSGRAYMVGNHCKSQIACPDELAPLRCLDLGTWRYVLLDFTKDSLNPVQSVH